MEKDINVAIDEETLDRVNAFIADGKYADRSHFVKEAIALLLQKLDEEYIGEQAKLLDTEETEEWFEGESSSWEADILDWEGVPRVEFELELDREFLRSPCQPRQGWEEAFQNAGSSEDDKILMKDSDEREF